MAHEGGAQSRALPAPFPAEEGEPPLDDPLVEWLAADQNIHPSHAARRIAWQLRADRLARAAMARFGDRFGGLWIDEADEGRLKVGLVRPTRGDESFVERSQFAGAADVVESDRSLERLRSIQEDLSEPMRVANHDTVWTLGSGLQPSEGVVIVSAPPLVHRTAAQQRLVLEAQARHGDAVRVEVYDQPAVDFSCTSDATMPPFCDPPLRGGVEIRHPNGDGTNALCTSGFQARSRSDGLPYLLTAGHCLRTQQSNIWRTRVTNGSSRLIGSRHRCQAGHGATNPCAQGDLDVGIIRVDNPSDWQWGRGFVFVRSSPGNDGVGGSSRHPRYRILRVRTLGADWEGKRVCASGRSRTSCGRVTHINRQLTVGGYTYRQLARTTMCQQQGDSGAPVYAYGTAYGLVKGGNPPCDTFYQGAVGAQDAMNVNIVLE